MRPWYLFVAVVFSGASCAKVTADAPRPFEMMVNPLAAAERGDTLRTPTEVTDPDGMGRLARDEVLVVGEVHGSQEVPAAFLKLVDSVVARSGPVIVALEMPTGAAAAGCASNASEVLDEFWTRKVQDGRSSTAMRALVCELKQRAAENRVRLVFFGSSGGNPSGVAKRLSAEMKTANAPMAVLVGNFHARNTPNSLVGMLRASGRKVTSLTTSSPDATTWNCGPGGCAARRMKMNFCPPDFASPYKLTKAIQDGRWDGCMVLPRLTASPPGDVARTIK